jgi:hypothetical protein
MKKKRLWHESQFFLVINKQNKRIHKVVVSIPVPYKSTYMHILSHLFTHMFGTIFKGIIGGDRPLIECDEVCLLKLTLNGGATNKMNSKFQ